MRLSLHFESWPTQQPFRITGKVFDAFDSVVVEIERDGFCGRGEAMGVFYLGESVQSIAAQIEAIAPQVEAGLDREQLQALLPPGGARQALDCALWDLEAKAGNSSIWALTGVTPRTLQTVYTIGLESEPQAMADKASSAQGYGLLKVKLDGDRPLERIAAIRKSRPDVRIVVDANQGWSFEQLQAVAPGMAEFGVEMIEQPLRRGSDAVLAGYASPVPLCADESCQHLGELADAQARYQMINIKLDKTGGLTHALALAAAARERGLGVMVGCMGGSSLSMAPAFVIGCISDLVDVDGPLLQKWDRPRGLSFSSGFVSPPVPALWG